MSPLKHSNNFAARMGRWSAGHWKTAVFGWLAFVIAAFVIGNAVGVRYLDDNDTNVGEARTADKIIEAGFPKDAEKQGEIVLIQSETLTADRRRVRSRDQRRREDARRVPAGLGDRRPARGRQRGPRLEGPSRRMVTFTPKGTFEEASLYIENIEAAVDKVQKRHGDFYVDELGSVSTTKATDAAFKSMLAKAGMIAIPLALSSCCSCSAPSSRPSCRCCSRSRPSWRRTGSIALPSLAVPVRRADRRSRSS